MLQLSFGWIKRDNSKFTVHLAPYLDIDCKKIDIVTGFCVLNEEGISKLRYTMLGYHGGQIEQSEKEGERERKRKRILQTLQVDLLIYFIILSSSSQVRNKTMSLQEFEPGCILN